MKNHLFLLLFFSCVYFLFAQKSTKKEIAFKGDFIQIDLGKIDHLEIQQINQPKITISTKELQQEATFLQVKQENNSLYIRENNTNINKMELPACIEQPLFTSYVIRIPKHIKITVNIDSGNFSTTHFTGNLNLNINNGEVICSNCSGNINIKNIDGIIICSTTIQNIQANSHLGKVVQGQKKYTKSKKDTKDLLIIETIRGNIFINSNKMP